VWYRRPYWYNLVQYLKDKKFININQLTQNKFNKQKILIWIIIHYKISARALKQLAEIKFRWIDEII